MIEAPQKRRHQKQAPRRSIAGVMAVGSAVGLSLFGDMAMYVILPVHYVALGLTALEVGFLLSANRWVRLVTNRVAERMVRRFGSRILFPAALAAGTIMTAGYAVAPSFAVLLALRLVWGVCWSFIRHTGVMTTVTIAGSQRAGRLMGVYTGLVQAGFVAGTFVAGLLFDGVGYQSTFLLAAALSLAAVPTSFLGNRVTRVTLKGGPAGTSGTSAGLALLAIRGFIVSLVGAGLVMSTLGYLLRDHFGDTVPIAGLLVGVTTVNGLLLAAQYLINSIGSPLFGIALDRHGIGRAELVGFTAAGTALLSLALLQSTSLLVPLVVLFFAAAAVSRLAVEAHAAVIGARAYAGLATSTDLGAAIGPLLGWIGIELARSGLVFWVGSTLFLAGAVLAVVQCLGNAYYFGQHPRC